MGHRQNYRSKKRKFTGNKYTNENRIQVVSAGCSDVNTASSSKLEAVKDVSASENSEIIELCGNRIMDIEILVSVFAILCCPLCFQNKLSLIEDSRFGLCSNFELKCRNCPFSKGFTSSKKVNKSSAINTLAVYALRIIGKGYAGGQKLFSMLDIPFLSKGTFREHELKIHQAAHKAVDESMNNAAKEVKILKPTEKAIVNCGVSVDGSWQKRGYSSLNGIVSCISVDTGKVLDIEIMSQFCRICGTRSRTHEAIDYQHICRNHCGSASSMETVGVYRIFERSKKLRNLCYTEYYGDGDSKAFNTVKDIYGENSVNKLECIGHIQKRVGTRLRKLKKTTKGLSGKGKLTDRFIDKLQNYYGIAIRSNVGNLQSMQKSVIAAFYHCCSNTKKSMHGQCPEGLDSWCKFKRAKSQNKIFNDKSPGLPESIINIVKPVYIKLCEQELLKKCLHGKTQNANESFNGVLWNYVPKLHFVELTSLQLGSYIAVLQFNDGAKGILSVLNHLNLNMGTYMEKGFKSSDSGRINDSKRKSLPEAKIQRKKLCARRKKKCVQNEEKEGLTYCPGAF